MDHEIKKAMILSAGFGTRVRPLSLVRPKGLFPVLNRPLIRLTLERLMDSGIRDVAVNTHHLAGKLEACLAEFDGGPRVEMIREPEILGTAGGVKNAARFFGDESFLVMNGDVVTDIDIRAAAADHFRRGALATLVLRDVPGLNNVAVDDQGRIRGFRGRWPESERHRLKFLAFASIHVMSPEILAHIPEGFGDMVQVYQGLIEQGALIAGHIAEQGYWMNIDGPDLYLRLHRDLLAEQPGGPVLISPSAKVEPGARFEDWAAVGPGVVIQTGAVVRRSVLWPGSRVLSGAKVTDCILADNAVAARACSGIVMLPDEDLCDTSALEEPCCVSHRSCLNV